MVLREFLINWSVVSVLMTLLCVNQTVRKKWQFPLTNRIKYLSLEWLNTSVLNCNFCFFFFWNIVKMHVSFRNISSVNFHCILCYLSKLLRQFWQALCGGMPRSYTVCFIMLQSVWIEIYLVYQHFCYYIGRTAYWKRVCLGLLRLFTCSPIL